MKKSDYHKLTKHSTRQENRFLSALDFDYVKIDERSFEDLVLFCARLAKMINFYNGQNQIEGDWSEFLLDEIVLLAEIKKVEPTEIETRYRENVEKANLFKRRDKKLHYLEAAFKEVYQMAQRFDQWFSQLKHIEQFARTQLQTRDEILNAIENKLGDALIKLRVYDIHARLNENLDHTIALDFSIFSPIWHLERALVREYTFEGETLDEKIRYLIYDLEKVFQAFYESLVYIKSRTNNYLKQSLQNDQHYPEVALLISFLKLFRHSQDNLNNLSQRYVEFYYKTILQSKTRAPNFDQVYLSFQISESVAFARVPKSQQFIGGEYENGEDIFYEALEPLLVNSTRVEKLYSVFLENLPFHLRGRQKDLIRNTLFKEIPISEMRPEPNRQEIKSYALFGESQSDKSIYERTMEDADMGFSIASPALFLSEGTRDISLDFQFEIESFRHLTQYLQDLSALSDDPPNEVFIKSFLEAFSISFTGPEGWVSVDKYVVKRAKSFESDEYFNTLQISFDIESNEAAMVAHNPPIHGHHYQCNTPVIRILLNSESYIYPYSLLNKLALEQISIHTRAREIKNLNLYSDIGPLDASNPFFPFGSIPHVGSYLVIGKAEIFQKSLDDLQLNIEWFNLPRDKDGFAGHYRDYDVGIDNSSFKARLSILDGGRWKPLKEAEQQTFHLFQDESGQTSLSEPLENHSTLKDIDIIKIKLPHNFNDIHKDKPYTNTSQRGFIKLELSGPENAFGHDLYPSVLSEIIGENSRNNLMDSVKRGFTKKPNRPLPKQPYTPQMKSLSLEYSSSSVINLKEKSQKENISSSGQFYHIYPYGTQRMYPDHSSQVIPLISSLDYQGILLIGLKDLNPPQSISILLEMDEGFSDSSEDNLPEFEWSYLAQDQWFSLAGSKILRDETKGFLKTGIIEIDLPREISNGNSILDPKLFWLQVSIRKNIENTSRLKSICTQVLRARLVNLDEEGEHLKNPLPAFTIKQSASNIVGIQTIIQPMPSFGGYPEESSKDFYTRISERLRHKQRAITAWDYERLILEKFSSIQKATCLSNMNSENLNLPGSVLIVVNPYPYQKESRNMEIQTSREVLFEIKSYLQQFISPFVNLEVRNPAFERVKIICAIKLAKGYNYGLYIQKLNEDINQYLIEDMLQNGKNVELGGKINTSDILSFMRTLPYIEFITKFSMVQIARDFDGKFLLLDTSREGDMQSFLQATKPWSALIPAEEHQITLLNDKEEIKSSQAGISDLELGNEFIVDD